MSKKTHSLIILRDIIKQLKRKGKIIVHCHGVFDLIHPGHLKHFREAKQLGDILVVTLTPDNYVNKGPNRPIYNQELRAESLSALEMVDYVAINETPSAVDTIYTLKPDIYAKGKEYKDLKDLTGHIAKEKKAVEMVNGRIAFIGETIFSSTALINEYFSILTPQTRAYLHNLKQIYTLEYILEQITLFENKRVLVIGDTIVDEYVFCAPVGIANKASCIDAKFLSRELHLGGAAGIANHLANFCRSVDFLSISDNEGEYLEFVESTLDPRIDDHFVKTTENTILVKKRFLTPDENNRQIFELTHFNHSHSNNDRYLEVWSHLKERIDNYDLVIVADYGYGFNSLNQEIIQYLCETDIFIAISNQTNSYNFGENLVTKYPRANYICLDGRELRLAAQGRIGSEKKLLKKIISQQKCEAASLIKGELGSVNWSKGSEFVDSIAFTTEVVDATGASSAYFALTSLCAHSSLPPNLTGFMGNCVGAMMVRALGHRESITPTSLSSFVTSLLK